MIAPPIRADDGEVPMASVSSDLENVLLAEKALWAGGPPHEVFKQMRSQCPIHWTERVSEYPDEKGFWSVTTADDIHTVSRDWKTYSSELGGVTAVSEVFPLERTRARSARSSSMCSIACRAARPAIWSSTSPSPPSRA